jgi:hypothetical protein
MYYAIGDSINLRRKYKMADTKRFLSVNIDVFNAKYVKEMIELFKIFSEDERIPEDVRGSFVVSMLDIVERHKEEVEKLKSDGIILRS